MKVFLSWSEERSRLVASALESWLPQVIQSVVPFMSTTLDAGVRWNETIADELDTHSLGILCVTSENVARPWLNFEAGSLARGIGDKGRLIPYLLDFASAGDLQQPLSQFNAVLADREGTWKVVKTLDGLDQRPRNEQELRGAFDSYFWPLLEAKINPIKASTTQPTPTRSDSDKLDEILELSRQLLLRNPPLSPDAQVSVRALSQGRLDRESMRRLISPDPELLTLAPEPLKLVDPYSLGRLVLQLGRYAQKHSEAATREGLDDDQDQSGGDGLDASSDGQGG